MSNLSLSEIIRYLSAGFIFIFIAYGCDPTFLSKVFKALGTIGVPFAAFVVGILTFLIYRPTIYNIILFFVLDRYYTHNVRQSLIDKYKISRKSEAEIFWTILKRNKLKEEFKGIDLDSSGIHFLYMTSIYSFAGMCYLFFKRVAYGSNQTLLLLVFGFVFFLSIVAAFLNDLRIEKLESKLLSTISDGDVQEIAEKLGYTLTLANQANAADTKKRAAD